MGELIYEMPKEIEKKIEVVNSIPSTWHHISCYLFAPQEAYNQEKIAENTRLLISGGLGNLSIVESRDLPYEKMKRGVINEINEEIGFPQRIDEILLGGKLFSSVVSKKAGFGYSSNQRMSKIKELIVRFISLGYNGSISSVSGYANRFMNSTQEQFYFNTFKSIASLRNVTEPQISLEWNENYGGKKENLEEILSKIQRLNLMEFQQQKA